MYAGFKTEELSLAHYNMLDDMHEEVLDRLGWTMCDHNGNKLGNTAGKPPVELPLIHLLALARNHTCLQLVMDTGAAKHKMVKRKSACGLEEPFLVTGANINEVVGVTTPLELLVSARLIPPGKTGCYRPEDDMPVQYVHKAAAAYFQAGAKPGFFHATRLRDESHCVLVAAVAADNIDVALELTTIPGSFRGTYPLLEFVRWHVNVV